MRENESEKGREKEISDFWSAAVFLYNQLGLHTKERQSRTKKKGKLKKENTELQTF